MRRELTDAWRGRLMYFECKDCHYATHIPWEQADRGRTDFCPACKGEQVRPWHELAASAWLRASCNRAARNQPRRCPGYFSYATRAKLIADGPGDEGLWQPVTDRVQQNFDRRILLVTNTGPRNEGYTYCTWCGLIEPTAMPTPLLAGTHAKPFPSDPKDRDVPGRPGIARFGARHRLHLRCPAHPHGRLGSRDATTVVSVLADCSSNRGGSADDRSHRRYWRSSRVNFRPSSGLR